MKLSKTIGTLLVTAAVGTFALVFTNPKKESKNKVKTSNSSTNLGIEEKEGLFI